MGVQGGRDQAPFGQKALWLGTTVLPTSGDVIYNIDKVSTPFDSGTLCCVERTPVSILRRPSRMTRSRESTLSGTKNSGRV